MEPTATPTAATPIVDIAPAARPATPAATLAQPPAEIKEAQPSPGPSATPAQKPLVPSSGKLASKSPRRATPVVAITLALVLFVMLSGLAYYAYSKTN